MKRIFIAITIKEEPEFSEAVSSVRTELESEKIKWSSSGNNHLTLAFLGDTEEKRIKLLSGLLLKCCTGFGQFDFTLAGMGLFKSYRDPRIIWAGIPDPGRLIELNNVITNALRDSDFPVEERPFVPHLTIGRIKSVRDTQNLRATLEKYQTTEFQKVKVKEVILFESILRPDGPLHKPLGKFSL